jgi:hypothetical protein
MSIENIINRPQRAVMFLPYLSPLIFVGIPILLIESDFWDGVIIRYGTESRNLIGVKEMLTTSGWELQFYLVQIELFISELMGISFHSINVVFLLISLLVIVYMVQFIAINLLGLKQPYVLFAGAYVGLMPYWSGTVSSILNIHTLCLAIGLTGLKLYLGKNRIRVAIGLFLIILSFQLNSLLLFLPVVFLLCIILNKFGGNQFNTSNIKLVFILLASVTYFTLKRRIDPPIGAYIGYNEFQSFSTLNFYKNLFFNIVSYSTFLIFPLFTLLLGLLVMICFKNQLINTKVLISEVRSYLFVAIIAVSAVLPYLMVGKFSDVRNLVGWSYRHTILFSVPLALLMALILSSIFERVKKDSPIRTASLNTVGVLSCVLLVGVLITNFVVLQNRSIFENDLKVILAEKVVAPSNGLVQIIGAGIPVPEYANYEANYLLNEVYPGLRYWGALNRQFNPNFGVPKNIFDFKSETYLYKVEGKQNSTSIYIDAVGYRSVLDAFRNVILFSDKKSISVNDIVILSQ